MRHKMLEQIFHKITKTKTTTTTRVITIEITNNKWQSKLKCFKLHLKNNKKNILYVHYIDTYGAYGALRIDAPDTFQINNNNAEKQRDCVTIQLQLEFSILHFRFAFSISFS